LAGDARRRPLFFGSVIMVMIKQTAKRFEHLRFAQAPRLLEMREIAGNAGSSHRVPDDSAVTAQQIIAAFKKAHSR